MKFTALLLIGCSAFAQSAPKHPREAQRQHGAVPADILSNADSLPLWTGTYRHGGVTYHYTMVGSDPAAGSKTTVVPTYIVPLKLTFADGTVFDSTARMDNTRGSAVQAVEMSPIFQPVSWMAGSIHVGTTQYVDAYQRANFWSSVSSVSPDYHVLIAPIVLPVQSYTVPAGAGSTEPGPVPGSVRATVSGSFLDNTITPDVFGKFPQITPKALTLFLTYNVFPGNAYGFHDLWTGTPGRGNTYMYVSYLQPWTDPIDADISTLAHEVAEWTDDPLINNRTPCGILENGDPLSDVIFEVTSNGHTWHPQDLVFVPWFTFQPSFSVNGWLTFRNTFTQPCKTH